MRLVMLNFSGNSSLLFSDNEFTDNWQLPENYKPHAYLGIVHGIAFTALKSYELWLFVCLASTERICTHQMLKSFAWESLWSNGGHAVHGPLVVLIILNYRITNHYKPRSYFFSHLRDSFSWKADQKQKHWRHSGCLTYAEGDTEWVALAW